jgi:hypothetical protein
MLLPSGGMSKTKTEHSFFLYKGPGRPRRRSVHGRPEGNTTIDPPEERSVSFSASSLSTVDRKRRIEGRGPACSDWTRVRVSAHKTHQPPSWTVAPRAANSARFIRGSLSQSHAGWLAGWHLHPPATHGQPASFATLLPHPLTRQCGETLPTSLGPPHDTTRRHAFEDRPALKWLVSSRSRQAGS